MFKRRVLFYKIVALSWPWSHDPTIVRVCLKISMRPWIDPVVYAKHRCRRSSEKKPFLWWWRKQSDGQQNDTKRWKVLDRGRNGEGWKIKKFVHFISFENQNISDRKLTWGPRFYDGRDFEASTLQETTLFVHRSSESKSTVNTGIPSGRWTFNSV